MDILAKKPGTFFNNLSLLPKYLRKSLKLQSFFCRYPVGDDDRSPVFKGCDFHECQTKFSSVNIKLN